MDGDAFVFLQQPVIVSVNVCVCVCLNIYDNEIMSYIYISEHRLNYFHIQVYVCVCSRDTAMNRILFIRMPMHTFHTNECELLENASKAK